MKKSVSILSGLVFVFLCSLACAKDEGWRSITNNSNNTLDVLAPERCVENYDDGSHTVFSLNNCVPQGRIDRDMDFFSPDYTLTMTHFGPQGGHFSYTIYFQTKKGSEEWSNEWALLTTSPNFGNNNLNSVEFYGCFPDYTFEPCEIRFMVEMYEAYDTEHGVEKNLVDTMIASTGYWTLMESELYDEPSPTPTPTPTETGRIYGTVSKENGKPLGNAQMTISSGDYFSEDHYFSDKTKTDRDGKYYFEELVTGKTYTITARKSGYQTEEKIIYLDKVEVRAGFVLKKTTK